MSCHSASVRSGQFLQFLAEIMDFFLGFAVLLFRFLEIVLGRGGGRVHAGLRGLLFLDRAFEHALPALGGFDGVIGRSQRIFLRVAQSANAIIFAEAFTFQIINDLLGFFFIGFGVGQIFPILFERGVVSDFGVFSGGGGSFGRVYLSPAARALSWAWELS
jgi:hypothetical protein